MTLDAPFRPVCLIPARLASTRFPRKLLEPFQGYPVLEHVRRRALLVDEFEAVIVATCDEEIRSLVAKNDGQAVMTSDSHPNGTSRIAEAVSGIDCTHVVLLQGDEPLVLPAHLSAMLDTMRANPEVDVFNAVGPVDEDGELLRVSSVKCTLSSMGRILYCFRRSPSVASAELQRNHTRKLLGLIAFRKDFLIALMTLPETSISQSESIEQMKLIEHGFAIQAVELDESLPGLNVPEDMRDMNACFASGSAQQACFAKIFPG